ncbi:hypothetical protein H6F93_16675 [Leptolyngbya sp. FACHB-671]|uniref:hypothetical protein n=1 Tax=Leptolyngbya sp. FACHB-671 TaxID=2692812 RepID=UPI001682A015|nr:hypothetical protein [Leptolyngbya sp. FACHB-671]MBD2069130.1 hypothetical protein [Leptolyngbya sp. FACHB-671]
MKTIFVDTCVWRHWFSHLDQPSKLTPKLKAESEAFQRIYNLVLNSDSKQFVFNQRIVDELGSQFAEHLEEKVLPFAKKVPIPLTRPDGAYKPDGSLICGGNCGGTLRDLLVIQGYKHADKLEEAATSLAPDAYLYNTKPRKKEFDIEHMESALECNAELFITADERTILNLLKQAAKSYPIQHPITHMHSIAKLPSESLNILTCSNH